MSAPSHVVAKNREDNAANSTQDITEPVRRTSSGLGGRNASIVSPRQQSESASPRAFERRERGEMHVRKTTSVDDMRKKALFPEGTS